MRRATAMVAVAIAAMAMLVACGDDDDAATTGTAAPTTTTAAPTTTSAAGAASTTTAAASATVTVGSTSLGDVLVDGDGRTLYVFTADTPDTSTCSGGCLQAWPRYTPAAVTAGTGVDDSLLGTITVDGVKQVTIDHRPLHHFASDSAPGDVQGQGVGGKWFVVAADGTPVQG